MTRIIIRRSIPGVPSVLDWTPERIALLKKLWPAETAAEIARQIGHGCTRNAVIGKAHRIKLKPKSTSSKAIHQRIHTTVNKATMRALWLDSSKTVEEIAEQIGCSSNVIYRLAREMKLPTRMTIGRGGWFSER